MNDSTLKALQGLAAPAEGCDYCIGNYDAAGKFRTRMFGLTKERAEEYQRLHYPNAKVRLTAEIVAENSKQGAR